MGTPLFTLNRPVLAHFARQWFLYSLALTLGVGLCFSPHFATVVDAHRVRDGIVMVVLFLTALTLNPESIAAAFRRPGATLLAVAINYGLVPLSAWALSFALHPELGLGLIVTATVPCTVASAAVWTRRAGGNDAIAILVTAATNLGCFVVTPLWLRWTTQHADVEIALMPMIIKLAYLILIPILLAQACRLHPSIRALASDRKSGIGMICQLGILSILFAGAVNCGLRLRDPGLATNRVGWLDFGLMFISVAILHTASLFAGQRIGKLSGLVREEWIAVGFAGSQKTLMIGLQVALMVGGGLTILPMVTYHVAQLLIDTVAADWLRTSDSP
ncbi:MAG: bile acid:sodium symporter [Planctomycetales bacterium]|nr:bile acid:sodium symporter [Planctomycetales bacterium]